MTKRLLALLLVLSLAVCLLAACGGNNAALDNGTADGGAEGGGAEGGGAEDGGAENGTEATPPPQPKEAELFFEPTADGEGYVVVHNATPDAVIANVPATHLGKPVVAIGNDAFYECTSLMTVTLPDTVTYIDDRAFFGCKSLISLSLPESLTSIGDYAFYDCCNIASLTLPAGVVHIGQSAFYHTAYYNDANNWEDGLLYLGGYLLHARPDVAGTCTVKAGTVSVAASAFNSCRSLSAVVLPLSVKRIGVGAFFSCTALTEIRYAGSAAEWERVEKEMYFDMDAGDYTVTCTDGSITK